MEVRSVEQPMSCVARLSRSLISRGLNNSLVAASWSDLQRANAPVKLLVLLLTTAAARLMVSSEMCKCVGVGDSPSEPQLPQELVSLSSRVGRLVIEAVRGECDVIERLPITWPEMSSHRRRKRRTGPGNTRSLVQLAKVSHKCLFVYQIEV